MLSRSAKAAYYALLWAPMRANALRHRCFPRRKLSKKVHLDPGQGNYLAGWTNVDANFVTAKIDIWADLRGTLPFSAEMAEAFHSHHVIEHLPDRLLPFHFAEMFRVLRPGGVIRVAGPNADAAIEKFQEGDVDWFSDFPDKRYSIGGRFANFILCGGEHLTILTSSYLAELAAGAGFVDISFCLPAQQTNFPNVFGTDVLLKERRSTPESPHTLVAEARRPG
jgi:predicted SAM-dependent methyltransferase